MAAAALVCAGLAAAQPVPSELETVVVAGEAAGERAFAAPMSIGIVDADEIRAAGPMVNLSEAIVRVPGIVANLRNNYAQDLQISVRGFGARSTFGIRGVRLYADGIPATLPDGQGQVSHFDLAGAQRLEVLRGPFSALYGSNSGGVISLVGAPATESAITLGGDVGSDGLWQARLGVEAPLPGGWNLRLLASRFNTEGVRPHSAAARGLANLRLAWNGAQDAVTLAANHVDQPAQDPLGLTREQFDADPFQTTPQAIEFDTRKTSAQSQVGVRWRHGFTGAGPLVESSVAVYAGQRAVTQWQAIPAVAQARPSHPGGVIDFDRNFAGMDARLAWEWPQVRLIAGVAVEQQGDARQGFENFTGTPPDRILGVTGALRRDEGNRVRTSDLYLQSEVGLAPGLGATLGLRGGRQTVRTQDRYLANGDDSGSVAFSHASPMATLQWSPSPSWNLYLGAGGSHDAPTLGELAYRPDGQPGLNLGLQAQAGWQVEAGAKWRDAAAGLAAELALFLADTDAEIGVLANAGGRSSYGNVGSTRRYGAELAARWQPAPDWRALLALSWLDARYRDGFETCVVVPCSGPADRVVVPAGNRIAGTMARSGFASVVWQPLAATEIGLELRLQGAMPVNDRNSDWSSNVLVAALRAAQEFALGAGRLSLLARVDNLANSTYAGAVIVGEVNGRYFETAAPRSLLLAAQWRVGF